MAQSTARIVPPVSTHATACMPFHPAHSPLLAYYFVEDCYCGDGKLLGVERGRRCDVPCSHKTPMNYACGGEDYLSVYDIPASDNGLIAQETNSHGKTMELLGCFSLQDNVDSDVVLLRSGWGSGDSDDKLEKIPMSELARMTNEVNVK